MNEEIIDINRKTCVKCGKTKLLSEFDKVKSGKIRYKNECKECETIYKHTCIVCGKQFESKGSSAKYCSKKCSNSEHKCICIVCKKEFYSISPNSKYCSNDCQFNGYKHTCKICGKIFKGSKSSKYCSDDCLRKAYQYTNVCKKCNKEYKTNSLSSEYCSECFTKRDLQTCIICNRKFYGTPSALYCSDECKNKRTCIVCGKKLDGHKRKYCSDRCSQIVKSEKNYNQGKILNQDNYNDIVAFVVKEIINRAIEARDTFGVSRNYFDSGFTSTKRTEIQERDRYTCRICGKKQSLEVHHIVKVIHGGNSSSDNLVTLCKSCHRAVDTLDLDYAIKKCMKNAEKNLGIEDKSEVKLNLRETAEISILELNAIYKKLTRVSDEIEVQESLIKLADIIDNLSNLI